MSAPRRLSLVDEREVDAICRRFEARVRDADAPPSMQEFVAAAPEHLRERLEEELTALAHELASTAGATDAPDGGPRRIGNYRILATIGQGGMGTVYEAVQEATRQRVALKIVRGDLLGAATRRRFTREVQLLGSLRHPGIAQLYDAGVDESDPARPLPYFAMELVHGSPLLSHCERFGLGRRDRLDLVRRVALAVQHAHDQGIVHRDLKSANILVVPAETATTLEASARLVGDPKIVDFGVARVVGRGDGEDLQPSFATHTSQLVGTISHMSPEQLEGGDVDGRADVYALGVILYQLVGGRLPHEISLQSLPAAVDSIRRSDPTPLGQLDRGLRGDVELIAQKALEKEPERRYQTAAEFADDLARHLEDVPIRARPASASDRLRKFARRNRGLFQGLLAAAAMLVVSLIVVTVFAVRQSDLREQAETRERHKAGVSDFLRDMLRRANLDRSGNTRGTTLYEVLVAAEQEIDEAFADDPQSRAAVRYTIGDAFHSQGEFERARAQHTLALEAALEVHAPDDAEVLDIRNSLAKAHEELADYELAEEGFRRVLDGRMRSRGPDHAETIAARHNLATLLERAGRLDEAERQHRALLCARQSDEDLALTSNNLGAVLEKQGRYSEAEALYRESLALRQALYEPPNRRIATAMHNLGILLWRQHQNEQAVEMVEGAAAQRAELLDAEHPELLASKAALAALLRDAGQAPRAADLLHEVAQATARRLGEHHPHTEFARVNHASVLRTIGEVERARDQTAAALTVLEEELPEGDPLTLNAIKLLGRCERDLGHRDRALALFERRLDLHRRFDGDHPNTVSALFDLAALHEASDRGLAIELYREAMAIADRIRTEGEPRFYELEGRKHLVELVGAGAESDRLLGELEVLLSHYQGSDREDYSAFVASRRGSK